MDSMFDKKIIVIEHEQLPNHIPIGLMGYCTFDDGGEFIKFTPIHGSPDSSFSIPRNFVRLLTVDE